MILFAYLGMTNYSRPILAVQDGDEFNYAGYISAVHVGISLVVSLVLFISYECGNFTKESLYRLPIPIVTKTRSFVLELEKLKLFKKNRGDARTQMIKKMDVKIQKHSNWMNLSLMAEASCESGFQFIFQSILAVPATLGLLKGAGSTGSFNDVLTLQNFSILAKFGSFAAACVSIRYLKINLKFDFFCSVF